MEAEVVPSVVVGHSQGEIAAATVAGGLSLADGAKVVALRSRALRAIAGTGAMVSAAADVAARREDGQAADPALQPNAQLCRPRAGDFLDVFGGLGGDPREVLHDVERGALAGQHAAGGAGNF